MDFYLHDTKQKYKRKFVPIDKNNVRIYVCGPTVYDRVHIGNGFSAVVFDVLTRLLRVLFPKVTYVRNITDIDDKIITAALANDEPIEDLTVRFSRAFHDDAKALYVLPPDIEPKPTELIKEIIQNISQLIERDYAYFSQQHVLFHVPSFENYGTLSGRSLQEMIDGARVEVAPYKRDPKDFVLWKPSTPEQPGWDSPWGRGRPGWHIECSAMIRTHLGSTIDIHGAGSDLMFPHNENELAQGVCIEENAQFVNYWMHNGMLNLGGKKMSKSLGNILTVQDALVQNSGEIIRYAFLSGHYRQSLLWTEDLLIQSKNSLTTLYRALQHVSEITGQTDPKSSDYSCERFGSFPEEVVTHLCDDLHTPKALAALHQIAKDMYNVDNVEEAKSKRDDLLAGAWLLGLLNESVVTFFKSKIDSLQPAEIEQWISKRNDHRKNGEFAQADEIRQFLAKKGVELEDTRAGTRWVSRQ